MKLNAIVYTSNTGYTKQYAMLLSVKTGLSVYSLTDAETNLLQGSRIIYMGWLMAGKVQGHSRAALTSHA